LLDDEIIAFLKEHGIRTVVSFEGPKPVQDAQRPFADGGGSYDLILPRIKRMLTALPHTGCLAMALGDDTDLLQADKTLREIGFRQVAIALASPSLFESHRPARHPWRRIDGALEVMENELDQWLLHIKNRNVECLKELTEGGSLSEALEALLHGLRYMHHCAAGRYLVGVSCSGDVFVCHRFVGQNAYKLGTIFDKELQRQPYLASPALCVDACMNCFARYHCAGSCKHDNLGMTGSIFTPAEDMCRIHRRRLELAAVLSCQLDKSDRAFLMDHNIIRPKPCPLDFPSTLKDSAGM
jgi:uncharacterized protein